ncbi:uncharacterized protein [Eurosta solidaginis]|uniref:uncharacterized protein n=1 Tax=Eurosta solidaginis TaxID=178769 RepID=UPI0035307FB0
MNFKPSKNILSCISLLTSNSIKMLSIQQLTKALRKLQNRGANTAGGDLVKQNLKRVVAATYASTTRTKSTNIEAANSYLVYPIVQKAERDIVVTAKSSTSQLSMNDLMISPPPSQPHQSNVEYEQQMLLANDSSQIQKQKPHKQQSYQQKPLRYSHTHDDELVSCQSTQQSNVSLDSPAIENSSVTVGSEYQIAVYLVNTPNYKIPLTSLSTTRSQRIHKFYQQHYFHTENNKILKNKQICNAMSSLAAEPKTRKQDEAANVTTKTDAKNPNDSTCNGEQQKNASDKPCFKTGFGEIIQFMELIGNLKHTKRTGWVLRNVSDPESISGHMYRMSMMTFLLDGSEGLNQIRCMELALVHDLAESVVGDLTPFCGVSKTDKRAMELKAMEDICKLIEPRGKRIMELFEEYETGESAESKFVKDLDRLDLIMQAFEYEKRDNCLLKHQEFFDSNEGKFNHPFIKKLVDEIYVQRENLARTNGATPPPPVYVPDPEAMPSTNGQHSEQEAAASMEEVTSKSITNSTS